MSQQNCWMTSFFLQEIHKLSTKKNNVKYGRKANLSTKSCSDISELEDNVARESKLLRNTRSCQKVAEQLVESPSGHLHRQ